MNSVVNKIKERLIQLYENFNQFDEPTELITISGEFKENLRELITEGLVTVSYFEDENIPLIYSGEWLLKQDTKSSNNERTNYVIDDYTSISKAVVGGLIISICGYNMYGYNSYCDDDFENISSLITISATTKQALIDLLNGKNIKPHTKNLPKNGIYRVTLKESMFGSFLETEEITKIQNIDVIHPCKKVLEDDLRFYFSHLSEFCKYNQKPLRKYLLYGEPGTGKTSLCFDIAKQYQEDSIVAFCTDIESVEMLLKMGAKDNRKILVIFEDCESTFRRSPSKILNFLDGVDCPLIKSGAAIIMTTNYPQEIEERILKRPGRIDKLLHVGALQDEQSVYDLFCFYFSDLMTKEGFNYSTDTAKKAISIVANCMTGAQVKELFTSYLCYMVTNQKSFNLIDVWNCRVQMFNDFNDVDVIENSTNFDFKQNEALLLKSVV